MSRFFAISLIGALCTTLPSQATVIQILHTNDLHASLETFGASSKGQAEYGGWAQLKAVMNTLTAQAKEKGIETIKLDAGDYTEGTSFYFSDHGSAVIRAFQDLGYDATAMGNHDWLMGAEDMDDLYAANPFPFPVLSANVKLKKSLKNLVSQIVPSTQILRAGIKFGIFGLSTDESLYSWIPKVGSPKNDMKIEDYREQVYADDGEAGTRMSRGIADDMIRKLRADNDVVIALTHIGYQEDKLLAAHSQGLDVIVGGHSHTFLHEPILIKDREGRNVPVVQTGFNGKYVGKMLLDVEPGKRPELISYELVPVLKSGAKDTLIDDDVKFAEQARKDEYGNRLDEVIGFSDDRLIGGSAGPTSFSKFVVDSMRSVSDADFIIDVGAFHGNTIQPEGPITRLNLMEMYPRKFEQGQNEGLYIYEAAVPGFFIQTALKFAVQYGFYVEFDGLTYDLEKISDADFAKAKAKKAGTSAAASLTQFLPYHICVRGKPIKPMKWYTFAGPESLVRGGLSSSPFMKLLMHHAHATSHTIWDAMNFYLLKYGRIEKIEKSNLPSPWSPGVHSTSSSVESLVDETLIDFKPEVHIENPFNKK